MPNRSSDILFQLIQSLEKSEKRNFKLYINRSSAKEELKVVKLFDVLDKMTEYDERVLLRKMPGMQKPQLANLKTHLYKEILASLRDLKSKDSVELQLNEMLDNARILYNKGLFAQSLRYLERAKEMGFAYGKFNFLSQIISLEKKIETLHITGGMRERAEQLATEALEVSGNIYNVFRLSNLALLLYSWYIQHGHARNEVDNTNIQKFFREHLPANANQHTGFYERLYLYQSYTWFYFIRQDFLQYYRYCQKWVGLFNEDPVRIKVETGHYIKGMHNLLNAHFVLRNYSGFDITLQLFEDFYQSAHCQSHDNFRINTFTFIYSAKLNKHLMEGSFNEGIVLIPEIEEQLQLNSLQMDAHRVLVFRYKFAILCFGCRQYEKCIDYLQEVINDPLDLRYDLQCYVRLLHLIAHYELGNFDLMEYLVRSVYRFMTKMQNLNGIEIALLNFLKTGFGVSPRQYKPYFEKLLAQIENLQAKGESTRAFVYLDVISWVQSKVADKSMSEVVHQKFLSSKHR